MEILVILVCVLLVMLEVVPCQERFVLLVNLERSLLKEVLVFLVQRIKEILAQLINVMLVQPDIVLLKEVYVFDVKKEPLVDLVVVVFLVLLAMNLTLISLLV